MISVKIDPKIRSFLYYWGEIIIRLFFAITFMWFGILKIFGHAPETNYLGDVLGWIPFLSTQQSILMLGGFEVLIGALFIFKSTVKTSTALLFVLLIIMLFPMFIRTKVLFLKNGFPYLPSMTGQFYFRYVMTLMGALIIGGNLKK